MVIRKELENKIRVVMEPMENYRSVSIGVWVQAGSGDETRENNGIAHVTEHMVFKGTKTRSAREIADAMTGIGDHLDAYTSKECTCFYTRTLGEYAYEALDIMGDMLMNARLDPEDMKKELGIILDEIDMYSDDADELCHELLQKEVWGDHPLGYIISGEKEIVRNFTPKDVKKFMRQYYTGRHLLISVAGNFQPEPMLEHIQKLFETVPAGESLPLSDVPIYRPAMVCVHKDIEQMHLDLAFEGISCAHPDRYVLSVVNSILGGNGNSRLFQEVREDKGLAYTVYSYGSSFKHCGLFQVYAAMAPEQTPQVLEAVFKAIDRMCREPVGEDELALTKRQIRTELYMAAESTHDRMESNAKAWLYDEEPETIEETVAHVEAITAEDVSAFMKKYIHLDKMGMALVGNFAPMDTKAVDDVLKKWGIPLKCKC
ncbi:MAG TPA: insulinase family protein [Candidatus Scybalocola faecavium]|nr:insulinase family protein [Candidatus Scybalocola faecavium]